MKIHIFQNMSTECAWGRQHPVFDSYCSTFEHSSSSQPLVGQGALEGNAPHCSPAYRGFDGVTADTQFELGMNDYIIGRPTLLS